MRINTHVVMAAVLPQSFSPNGDYYAYSSPDGSLKIWETLTGVLKQEYTHSSHLSATCSCLSWGPSRNRNDGSKKSKKRRSSGAGDALCNLTLVGMGTTSGSILLYSLVKGDLHTQLIDGHTDTVNDLCWNGRGDAIYSCSNDHHIVQWDVGKAQVKQKWKGDKGPIHAVALCATENHLLSASHTIKLWDTNTQQVLKTFTGHASEVFGLIPIVGAGIAENGPSASNGSGDGNSLQEVAGTYFLTAAQTDRLINAWQISISTKSKTALGTFALPEEPVYMQVSQPRVAGQPILLLAVTKSGQLLVFEHTLNGRCKKPLQPRYTVQISTSSAVPLPVLCATMKGEGDTAQVLITHGNFMKPTFEPVPCKSLEASTCLIRDDPNKSNLQLQTAVTKVKTPQVSKDMTVLAPGHMAPHGPVRDEVAGTRKKRRKSTELSMEEQLHAMSIDKPGTAAATKGDQLRKPPKADHQATLLAQGLQSKDKTMLNSVFQISNELMIRNTVRRLPVPVIVPLVLELSKRMHGHAQSGHNLIKWVRVVLTVHTSYLMTFPELVDTLGSLYQMMDSRTALFNRLSRLQGKLDLMLSQVTSQGQEEEDSAASQQPLLLYQDDSDSDEVGLEDLGVDVKGGSESEDNWEELSDMEEDDEDDEATGAGAKRKRRRDEEDDGQKEEEEESDSEMEQEAENGEEDDDESSSMSE